MHSEMLASTALPTLPPPHECWGRVLSLDGYDPCGAFPVIYTTECAGCKRHYYPPEVMQGFRRAC